jgi:hypothetical protein
VEVDVGDGVTVGVRVAGDVAVGDGPKVAGIGLPCEVTEKYFDTA